MSLPTLVREVNASVLAGRFNESLCDAIEKSCAASVAPAPVIRILDKLQDKQLEAGLSEQQTAVLLRYLHRFVKFVGPDAFEKWIPLVLRLTRANLGSKHLELLSYLKLFLLDMIPAHSALRSALFEHFLSHLSQQAFLPASSALFSAPFFDVIESPPTLPVISSTSSSSAALLTAFGLESLLPGPVPVSLELILRFSVAHTKVGMLLQLV